MGTTTKHRFVLQIQDAAVWPEYRVRFTREPDDHSDVPNIVDLALDAWHDLGDPTEITVTVKPGDHLNPEGT